MKSNQTLFDITANSLLGLEKVLEDYTPDLVFVQGDTTSAFTSALASFYKKIKVAHVEAGLRSYKKYSPFPEELNRVLVGHLADYHFAPTEKSRENLALEGIKENVWVVGNSVIDALFLGLEIVEKKTELKSKIQKFFLPMFDENKDKVILVTGYRRESFGDGFRNICKALKKISERYKEIKIIYPVHLNPNVKKPVYDILKGIKNIYLIEPLDYPYLILLMSKCFLVLIDSGGIQEEAPSLGKPVLVMREVTERNEGIESGTSKLVGTDEDVIFHSAKELIENKECYDTMAKSINPYGDGNTSKKKWRLQELFFRVNLGDNIDGGFSYFFWFISKIVAND